MMKILYFIHKVNLIKNYELCRVSATAEFPRGARYKRRKRRMTSKGLTSIEIVGGGIILVEGGLWGARREGER